jgi:charged multivesicular body protein 5
MLTCSSYDIPDDVDEEELDAEFEALAGEMELEHDMAGLEGVPSYLQPEVPEFVDAPVEEGKGKEAEKVL